MLRLQITRDVRKFLDTLPPKQFRQVMQKILALLTDPMPHDTKELKGYPLLRNDIGEYRIIYQVLAEDVLHVVLVGKRNDSEVYRKL